MLSRGTYEADDDVTNKISFKSNLISVQNCPIKNFLFFVELKILPILAVWCQNTAYHVYASKDHKMFWSFGPKTCKYKS